MPWAPEQAVPPKARWGKWWWVVARIAADTGIGEDRAAMLVHLLGSELGVGDDRAAMLVHLLGRDTSTGSDSAAFTAHLTGGDLAIGDDRAAFVAHLLAHDDAFGSDLASAAARLLAHEDGEGSDRALLKAYLLGDEDGLAHDTAGMLAHLTGAEGALGFDSATCFEHWYTTGYDTAISDDRAIFLARLLGDEDGEGSDRSGVMFAHLLASGPNVGYDSATAKFSPHAAETTVFDFTTVNAYQTYTIPSWCTHLDVIACGAGGGGGGGDGGLNTTGEGGRMSLSGTMWDGGAHARGGGEIPWDTQTLSIRIGQGGEPGPKEADGGIGAPSLVRVGGAGGPNLRMGPAGEPGRGAWGGNGKNTPGVAAGDFVLNGITYTGGLAAAANVAGNPPGGGGGPGTGGNFGFGHKPGQRGGNGRVWIRAYQL